MKPPGEDVGMPVDGDVVIDARGLRCPMPVLRLANVLSEHAPGTLVRLLATDPAARVDVPALVRMRGFDLVAVVDEATWTAYHVRRPAPDPTPDPAPAPSGSQR